MKEFDIAHKMLKVLDEEFEDGISPSNVSHVIAHIIFHFLVEAPNKDFIRPAFAQLIDDVDVAQIEEIWDEKHKKSEDSVGEPRIIH